MIIHPFMMDLKEAEVVIVEEEVDIIIIIIEEEEEDIMVIDHVHFVEEEMEAIGEIA